MRHEALIDTTTAVELSLAEWATLPEETGGELVDGRLVEEEMPDFIHELLVARLIHLLYGWVAPRGGFVAGSDARFAIGARQGRKPDLTVYFPGSPRPPARGAIEVPPDVAVEIVSPTPRDGRRDRVEKVAEYASFGIRYYWIVDPELRSLEILELGADEHYTHLLGASTGTLDEVPGCPGLSLDLNALWAEIDRLENE